MLKIFEKTKQEIIEELKGKMPNKRINYIPEDFCKTYVITKDNEKVETRDMTEGQILSFISQAIIGSVNSEDGSIKQEDLEGYNEAKRLLRILDDFTPSYFGMKAVLDLFEHENSAVRSYAMALLMPICEDKMKEIESITKFLKETQGDFSMSTKEEKIQVVNTLADNERMRSQIYDLEA